MTWFKIETLATAGAALLIIGGATTAIVAQNQTNNNPPGQTRIEQEVIDAERTWSDAVIRHNRAAIESILADDFVGIDGRGWLTDKTAELKEAEAPPPGSTAPKLVKEEHSEIRVRLYGGTAVMTCINTATFSTDGNQSQIRYRRTTVWVKPQGRWQCVSFHGSRIMEPARS
jgi:ketosteroid isomerase-like protein